MPWVWAYLLSTHLIGLSVNMPFTLYFLKWMLQSGICLKYRMEYRPSILRNGSEKYNMLGGRGPGSLTVLISIICSMMAMSEGKSALRTMFDGQIGRDADKYEIYAVSLADDDNPNMGAEFHTPFCRMLNQVPCVNTHI